MVNPEINKNEPDGKEILALIELFATTYNIPPFDSYISYFDHSTVGKYDKTAPEDKRGESCIVVKLKDSLPPGENLPDRFKGVRVFVSR